MEDLRQKKYIMWTVRWLLPIYLCMQLSATSSNVSGLLASEETNPCDSRLKLAEEEYYEGEFETAMSKIDSCLNSSSLTRLQLIKAYTLRARIFIAENQTENARESIRKILIIDPYYNPTLEEEKPQYIALVKEVREQNPEVTAKSKKNGISKWIWISAGTVTAVAVITLAAISGGEKGDNTKPVFLPEPPDFPTGN